MLRFPPFATAITILTLLSVQSRCYGEQIASRDSLQSDASQTVVNPSILVTTTLNVDGYRVREYKGIVRGVTVRQPTVSQHFKAELKGIVGGKMSPYTTMCETARQQAYEVMVEHAQSMGANAVLGMRYDSSSFQVGDSDVGTEVACYGTAVVLEHSASSAEHVSLVR